MNEKNKQIIEEEWGKLKSNVEKFDLKNNNSIYQTSDELINDPNVRKVYLGKNFELRK